MFLCSKLTFVCYGKTISTIFFLILVVIIINVCCCFINIHVIINKKYKIFVNTATLIKVFLEFVYGITIRNKKSPSHQNASTRARINGRHARTHTHNILTQLDTCVCYLLLKHRRYMSHRLVNVDTMGSLP